MAVSLNALLTRGVENILPNKAGLEKFMSSKKIRVYLGVDPTGNRLHLGHTIPLRKLNDFAKAGHKAILLIGTGTVLAGDPSQRGRVREKISKNEIKKNIKTWRDQAGKVVDLSKVQIMYNADWLLKLNLADIIDIASHISATQLFKREMFQKRLDSGDTVWTHELLYPLLQGYDSVALDVDLEIGGTDQTFNMLIGRQLQKKMKSREKYVLTTPLINGTDGKPMSKTSGNCIWIDDPARDMFAKVMSISDAQIKEYWEILTELDPAGLKNLKPLEAKKKLAFEITKIYHGENQAKKAEDQFRFKVHPNMNTMVSLPTVTTQPGTSIEDFLTQQGYTSSASIAKQMITSGSIDINNIPVSNRKTILRDNQVVKIGKKEVIRVKIKK